MSESFKGIPNLYDEILDIFSLPDDRKITFYEWISPSTGPLTEGQLCYAVIHFFKRKRWFLEEHRYLYDNEKDSTWYARELAGRLPENQSSGYVKKYFDLQTDESLITVHCKVRPVILIKKNLNDWWNPSNASGFVESWTCLPLFSYKDRHIQSYGACQEFCVNRFSLQTGIRPSNLIAR